MAKVKTKKPLHDVELPPQFGYRCEFEKERTYYHSEGEGYSSYTQETYSNKYIGVEHSPQYPDVTSIHAFKKGDKAYLVWIEYSTGDSFRSCTRSEVLPIALFQNEQDALDLKNNYQFWNPKEEYVAKKHQEYKGSQFRSSDGQLVSFPYAPWTGYFENLDEIHIQEVEF